MNSSKRTPPKLLHEFFLFYADEAAEQKAIIFNDEEWTYRDLAAFSHQYAEELRRLRLRVGSRIILEMDPCPQAVALIIACSMLGLVFIPISPDTPTERIRQIIKLTQASVHIRNQSNTRQVSSHLVNGYLERNQLSIPSGDISQKERDRTRVILETDLAYIIFTSGTTGVPKGIMMSHKAVLSCFEGLVEACNIPDGFRIGSISPLQFDFSLIDIGLALGSKATLVQVPRILFHHPTRFVKYLIHHNIDQMDGVPAIFQSLCDLAPQELNKLTNLTTIMYGGESMPVRNLRYLSDHLPNLQRIVNAYGQSEYIGCSFTDVAMPLNESVQAIPIGWAHPGAELFLLDEENRLVTEPSVVGELYMRGSSLFSGYYQDQERTDQVLIPHPLRADLGEKVFKTGDLGYIGMDGQLYYHGRKDSQIKLRGNRIELEEIERVLMSHPNIVQAVVLLQTDAMNPFLYAIVVPQSKQSFVEAELRSFCLQKLPNYSVPTQFIAFDSIPYTINGKVDKKKLREAINVR